MPEPLWVTINTSNFYGKLVRFRNKKFFCDYHVVVYGKKKIKKKKKIEIH